MPPDDFFDEDWEEPSQTQETAITRPAVGAPSNGPQAPPPGDRPRPPRRPRMPGGFRLGGGGGGGGGGPRRPLGQRTGQLEYGRLAVLGAGILVLIVIAYLAFNGGGSGSSPTAAYFTKVSAVLTKSDQLGTDFRKLLIEPTLTPTKAHHELQLEVTQAQALLVQAQAIKPTSQLADVHPYLLQALQYRVNGLECLAQTVVPAAHLKSSRAGARELSGCAQKLLASDVIYADSYYTAATDTLRQDKIVAQVPTSRFLKEADTPLVLAPGFVDVLSRLKPGSVRGVHGVQLVSVTAEPSGKTLVPGQLNRIPGVTQTLGFRIVIKDSGHFQEVSVPVKLTLTTAHSTALQKTAIIGSILRGASAPILIGGFFTATNKPLYSQPYTLRVAAGPVPGEKILSNNKATFQVSFLVAG